MLASEDNDQKNSYSIKELLGLSWKAILKIFVQNIIKLYTWMCSK